MAPDSLRKSLGFAACAALPATLATVTPALAQGPLVSQWLGAAPMAVALGAGAFGVLALVVLDRRTRRAALARQEAGARIAGLSALVDQYEALLSGPGALTVIWTDTGTPPRILGQPAAVLAPGRPPEAALNLASWLGDADADRLASAIEALRVGGRTFELALTTRDGRLVRASGATFGGGAALSLRAGGAPAAEAPGRVEATRALIAALPDPAFLRDEAGRLVFANTAWHVLARSLGRTGSAQQPAELLEPPLRRAAAPVAVTLGAANYSYVPLPLPEGSAGVLRAETPSAAVSTARPAPVVPEAEAAAGLLAGVIDALSVPVAIFDRRRELVRCNSAYATLWGLDPAWLQPGLEERTILDRLRTDGRLPAEADYHAWRTRHLNTSYELKARRNETWHLPDGRSINVVAAPAGSTGGVLYVFEDITDQLRLKSINRALLDVQRSTINALTEAVAVFGTNGRLTLSNPRLSALWKIPLNELGQNPHIDQLAEVSAKALPEDGAAIWRDLKRKIVDLTPHRTDASGRITRADGRLLDYSIIRLPDGQTMITFLDVTESASYSRVLKERNDALITADRLKDAFVQNVSYELRSPLTNIIGFADLLADEAVGPLNERQRAYTDYIRASSETLGVLIDNILDLATVDAGIAELRPATQNVAALVEKARAGLAATFPAVDGERGLDLVVEVPPNLPPLVADGTRIVQVLYNLLSSAVRFSERGAPIRLAVEVRGGRMVFIVEDEGTAVTEELRAAVERGADTGIAGRQRGAGLGLAIVRAFVSLHGGTITVEKREPRGNRVIVSLPREVAAAGAAE